MESFYFGNAERPLYSVYHAADPAQYRSRSVLLLYPMGQEYMRIHRAFRRIADSLSVLGFDVFRFDYACTGDSHGEFEQATLIDWQNSAITAYDELKAMSPLSKIDIVALRVGTIIARTLVERRRVERLILWEPKFRDSEYLDELIADIENKGSNRANYIDAEGRLHHNGYCYNLELQAELRAHSWTEYGSGNVKEMLVLSTLNSDHYREFSESFSDDLNLTVQQVDGPDDWTVVDSFGGLFFPEPSIVAIKKWLSR